MEGGVAVLWKLRGNGGLFYTIFSEKGQKMEAVNESKILMKTKKKSTMVANLTLFERIDTDPFE